MLTVNTQLLKPFCWRRTSLSLCRLTEVELQFNVQLSSPGKTRSVRSADYTPAQTLPGCCSMSGRDGEGLHHCLKWSSVWVFFFSFSANMHRNKDADKQVLLHPPCTAFLLRFYSPTASFCPLFLVLFPFQSFLSFPISPISSFLTSISGVLFHHAPSINWLCPVYWKLGRRPKLVIL